MPSISENISFVAYAMIILVQNFPDYSRSVFEADHVRSSHLSGSGIAHAIEFFVEYINLFLAQRIFKGNTERVRFPLHPF